MQSDTHESAEVPAVRSFVSRIRRRPVRSAVLVLSLLLVVDILLLPIPTLLSYRIERPRRTAFQELYVGSVSSRRTIKKEWVSLARVSPYAIRAVLVSEDASFWSHNGFDWYEVQATIEKSLSRGRVVRGASTITQQLVKNLFLSPSRNPLRKWHEALLTVAAEVSMTKSRILELYLNEIEWGDGVYGIQAASRHYFGKSASDLTPAESALLAAVIPNPRRYSLLSPSEYVVKRSARIRRLMNVPDPVQEAAKMDSVAIDDSLSAAADTMLYGPAEDSAKGVADSTWLLFRDDSTTGMPIQPRADSASDTTQPTNPDDLQRY